MAKSIATKSDIIKKRAMIQALEVSLGIVTTACKKVGINRDTHYEWMKRDEQYKADVESISDIALDFAESKLHEQINNGEVSSTIFYLKTKGKRRGYIERVEQDTNISINKPFILELTNDSDNGNENDKK